MILYIIDKTKEFTGSVYNTLSNGVLVDYTDELTFEEYKKEQKNPNLITITQEELHLKIEDYRNSMMKEFEEIDEEEYDYLFECLPPMKFRNRQGITTFYIVEAWTLYLHTCCFRYNGRCYKAIRSKFQKDEELINEILEFLKKQEELATDKGTEEKQILNFPVLEYRKSYGL